MLVSCFLFVLLTCVSGKTDYQVEENVAVLTKDNFDAVIEKNKFVMVEFYAPWCGHCKALKPEYEKAAGNLASTADVVIAKVDATVETELASTHGVSGYPTLKFHKNGKWIDYNGDRKAEAIITWIQRKMGPAFNLLESVDEMDKLTKSNSVVIVGFIKEGQQEAEKVLEDVAEKMDNFVFGMVRSKEICEKFNVSKDVQFTMFKAFDDGRADFDGDIDSSSVTEFVKKESIPLIVEFSEDTSGSVFGSPIHNHLVAFVPRSKDYQKLVEEMRPIAKKFKGQVHFIVVDTDLEDHKRILDFFGVTQEDLPGYRLIKLTEDMVKYKPDTSDFSYAPMSTFIDEVLSGTRAPFLLSEDIPPESDVPVRVLVGKNYNEVTKDESKAVFVELYAPWCGHCRQLEPIWSSLGEAFKYRKDIIIAKMDATVNEAENLRVHSFPTLKYYPKGSQEVIDHTGERTLEALKKFVESEGKIGGTEPDGSVPEEPEEEKELKDEL